MNRAILLLFFPFILSCGSDTQRTYTIADDITFLADDALGGRETGTEGEQKAAHYIADRMKHIELEPKGNAGSYFQTFTFKPSNDPHEEVKFIDAGNGTTTGTNVVGYIDNGANKTVIIGAHYDHLGFGGRGSLHRGENAVHNGADDNASGVAVMLQLADRLKEGNKGSNYLFIAFSGEEMGLLGSNFYSKNATIDLSKANFMINMDMVGRLKPEKTLAIHGTGTARIWPQVLNSVNKDFDLVLKESGIGPSDHTSFYLQDIPVLHFFTGQHEDYHKPSDDHEKLNYEGMQAISDYILEIITELDDDPKLTFKKTKNESEQVPRFKVALGVIPDYLFDGNGMRIDGISEDKPAQKAGLEKGDIVVKLGKHEVTDMMSYMKALSTFEEGMTTMVTVNRNGEEVEKEVTFLKSN